MVGGLGLVFSVVDFDPVALAVRVKGAHSWNPEGRDFPPFDWSQDRDLRV